MNQKVGLLRAFLLFFIRATLSPVVLIGFLGPFINLINLLILKNRLNSSTTVGYPELKMIIDNQWSDALVDFTIAMYTLLLAVVFMYIGFLGAVGPLVQKYTWEEVMKKTKNSTYTLIVVSLLILFFIIGILLLQSGAFATPDLIGLYLHKEGISIGPINVPPFESIITLARIVIVIFGFVLYYWGEVHLPQLIENTNDKKVNKVD